MKLKIYLVLASCLVINVMHSMDLARAQEENPQLASLLFNKLNPSHLLKSGRTFGDSRCEQFTALTRMLNPKVLAFVQDNPTDTTAQAINRSLNLVASKMAFFIGENAPVLDQDLLNQDPQGNPIHALFNHSARASRDTMVLLLPIDYFLTNKDFLIQKFADKAEVTHKAFIRSIEQLGGAPQEITYIAEGRIQTDEEVEQESRRQGADILTHFALKEAFFKSFCQKIKKTKVTDLVDEEADLNTAALLKNTATLQKLRSNSQTFGTSQDAALKMLADEQAGLRLTSNGSFSFDCNHELQQMTFAIADHKNEILQKIVTMISTMHATAQSFDIDGEAKKFFLEECEQTKELIERAQVRCHKLEIILPDDAKKIGPRSYALSNLYGTLSLWAKNKNEKAAQNLVSQSAGMYRFVQMQG